MNRILFLLALALSSACVSAGSDPLPSWNEGASKLSLIRFVEAVTKPGSTDFVAPAERIAVFDNDGTLWIEQPLYTQLVFALEQVQALAPERPEWKDEEPFRSVLAGDLQGALAGGEEALLALVMATHAGLTTDEFRTRVEAWIAHARHPRLDRPYTSCVYQPMLELLDYLRENDFQTFIVSGGGADFMRPWTLDVYGIPPSQVVGSLGGLEHETRAGEPVLVKTAELHFIDDKEGKPVGIQHFIGGRPILAFGNSDGDHAMLRWTAAGEGARLLGLVHHTDSEREYAYDRQSKIGRLDKALDEARARGWTVVDMKTDWKAVFPENPRSR